MAPKDPVADWHLNHGITDQNGRPASEKLADQLIAEKNQRIYGSPAKPGAQKAPEQVAEQAFANVPPQRMSNPMANSTTSGVKLNQDFTTLDAAARQQREDAKFVSDDRYAWVADFANLSHTHDDNRFIDAKNKDMSGAGAFSGLRNTSTDPEEIRQNREGIREFITKGLNNLSSQADDLLPRFKQDAAADVAYQPMLDDLRQIQEKVRSLGEKNEKLLASFNEKGQALDDAMAQFNAKKAEHEALVPAEVDAEFAKRQSELETQEKIFAERTRDITDRFNQFTSSAASYLPAMARDMETGFNNEWNELDKERDKHKEAIASLAADRSAYESNKVRFSPENVAKVEEDHIAGHRELNETYRNQMFGTLDEARVATEGLNRVRAESLLQDARRGGNTEEIEEAERRVAQLPEKGTISSKKLIEGAAHYENNVEKGAKARSDLRAKSFEEFVDGLVKDGGELQLAFDKRVANAKSQEERDSINEERTEFVAALKDKGGDNHLTAQIKAVEERLTQSFADSNNKFDKKSQLQVRNELYEFAMKNQDKPETVASQFLAQHRDPAVKGMAAVKLSDLEGSRNGETVALNPADILKISFKDGRTEVMLRGDAEKGLAGKPVILSESQTKKIFANGLDVSESNKNLALNIDAGLVGAEGEKLVLSGKKKYDNIAVTVNTGRNGNSWNADMDHKLADTYEGISSVGPDQHVSSMVAKRSQNAFNNALDKEEANEKRAFARMDSNKDGKLEFAEVVKRTRLDRDGDGEVSKEEYARAKQANPAFDALFASAEGKGLLAKLQGMETNGVEKVSLEELGNVQLATVTHEPAKLASRQAARATQQGA